MQGMSRVTGKPVSGLEHLRQSIEDILTTRIGTRVERRDYGSRLPELVDQPVNGALKVEVFAATVQALRRWEPRLQVKRVRMLEAGPGYIGLEMEAVYLPEGRQVTIEEISVG